MDGKVLKGEQKAPSSKKVVIDVGKSKKIGKVGKGNKGKKEDNFGRGHGRLVSSRIEHHPDRSRTVEHTHEDGFVHKHAVPDLDGVHDSLEAAANEPNEGEEQPQDQAVPNAPLGGAVVPQMGQ